ncbi:MAG: hypothetical protein ACI81R_000655 [Bradymonadia bacterium]|jgi:hypothetical protein
MLDRVPRVSVKPNPGSVPGVSGKAEMLVDHFARLRRGTWRFGWR